MSDFTFLFNRKGALYPLDFASTIPANSKQANSSNEQSTEETSSASTASKVKAQLMSEWPFNNIFDSTLVHLCSKVIVSMPTREIERITDLIPTELFVPLFKASLYPVKDNAIDVRVKKKKIITMIC